jgi:hypothetical protein
VFPEGEEAEDSLGVEFIGRLMRHKRSTSAVGGLEPSSADG